MQLKMKKPFNPANPVGGVAQTEPGQQGLAGPTRKNK
jgi:hypothetical protein